MRVVSRSYAVTERIKGALFAPAPMRDPLAGMPVFFCC